MISVEQARERIVSALGLGARIGGFATSEVLAGLVRRAASLIAPCPPMALKQRVLTGLQGLVDDDTTLEDDVDEAIEALTSYGDLIELPAPNEEGQKTYLYAAPPSFVETAPGTVFLLGVPADGQGMLPGTLGARIKHRGHTRSMQYSPSEALPTTLRELGLHSLQEKLWFKQPRVVTAAEMKQRYDKKLGQTKAGDSAAELLILETSKPVTYYRGRWGSPQRLNGKFVGRREQRYGSPLWCYVELEDGRAIRLLDLPPGEWRGCDQAWHLQMALDALAGAPQQFTAELTKDGSALLRVFSPLPAWWQRRWDVLGTPVRVAQCLCAYELPYEQYVADLPRLKSELWLSER